MQMQTVSDVINYRWEYLPEEKLERYYNRCAVLCNMIRTINYYATEDDKRLDIELELETILIYIDFKMNNN